MKRFRIGSLLCAGLIGAMALQVDAANEIIIQVYTGTFVSGEIDTENPTPFTTTHAGAPITFGAGRHSCIL